MVSLVSDCSVLIYTIVSSAAKVLVLPVYPVLYTGMCVRVCMYAMYLQVILMKNNVLVQGFIVRTSRQLDRLDQPIFL